MRYAIFSDIHANLEALEAVLAKIDELAQEEPIDQIWFLGDLVGYGPNPNECIVILRDRTDVIIAGNHDWAAVGKIDLEDFSAAARISAEWTAKELTEEHRTFLTDLPERLELGDCTLVHGSPYGPLWEYLTSEMLAERSFRHFSTRYCFVGHTHVPVIFQQPIPIPYDDAIANAPTVPLASAGQSRANGTEEHTDEETDDETVMLVAVHHVKANEHTEEAHVDLSTHQQSSEDTETLIPEPNSDAKNDSDELQVAAVSTITEETAQTQENNTLLESSETADEESTTGEDTVTKDEEGNGIEDISSEHEEDSHIEGTSTEEEDTSDDAELELQGSPKEADADLTDAVVYSTETSPESVIRNAEEQINSEIEELLTLLGLSQSMIQVTNEMLTVPEGHWQAPDDHRFIINPGGVGQPRDGDPRAAFMIYDTEHGFEFYRVPYDIEKTQEKIIKVGLPQYLAMRLAFGR